jgi:hypothetical protein
MRSPVLVLALTFGLACGGYAFAADEAPQPLTRADCDAAGMTWNDGTNVCGSADTMAAAPAADSSGDMAATQPLTRADCEAAGMKWNDNRNVCGVGRVAAAAAAAAHAHKKEMKKEVKKGGTKIVKKVKTSHGVKKTVIHKKGKQDAAAKKGGFLQWLNGKNKKKS